MLNIKKAMLLLCGALLVGTSDAQSYKGPKVQITYLHGFTGADRPVMEKLVQQFNAAHPNIQVRAQAQPWGTTWQQLPALVASGRAADVVVINEDQITNFIARGAVSPLTDAELKSAGIDKNRFYGPLFKTADYKGASYGLPISAVAYTMFYNKDLMKKAGLDPNKPPQNYTDLVKAAQACTTDKSGKKAGEAGFDAKNLDTWGISLYNNWVGARAAYAAILQNGGSLVDKDLNAAFNSPQAVEGVQRVVDLVTRHNVARPNSTEEAELAAFSQGKVCFFPSGQWYLDRFEQQKMNFGVAFMPRIGDKQDAAWGGSSHLTLPKQKAGYDKNKRAAALEFVNWMTQPAQNLAWTEAGSLPIMAAVAKDKKFEGRPISGVFSKLDSIYATSGFPWGGQVLGPFDNAWANAFSGKKSVKQALDDGVKEANQQIAQARKNFQ
ncbi:ABC transporter substrate-binding protein [Deinococcus peraridilitoris]|uniref:ABC-type sugar transport system, periplasmic component n=1 Tax=Deinococcus peraridilitoris (strain DSM 19664 / LMG 22246 / CIP 109416 / KR-200) TaxID=937777 RepID=K9ZXZ5_DEIPD|nr:ABC transporter substrate-binding protein [Deinococcus peraridilitoris]AFZ66476.1 ABC-type sugar transport system, periplasmic component [Deinococcus peraridilitoris DSM 19664]